MIQTSGSDPDDSRHQSLRETVDMLMALMAATHPALRQHSERVADLCASFCEKYGLTEDHETETLYFAAQLHDIGLMPHLGNTNPGAGLGDVDSAANSPEHPAAGADILSHLGWCKAILPIVRHHHEAFDGSGFPDGLKGDDIPLGARLVALCDAYAHLVARDARHRANKSILEEIRALAGTRFDPSLVDRFAAFIDAHGRDGASYGSKRAKAAVKEAFNEILNRFKAGKIEAPVMPQVVTEVRTLISEPNSTAEDLAAVIEREPVISLRLVAVANSPVYRGFQEIQSVRKAIPRLGMKETLNIVIAIANKSLYETKNLQFRHLMDQLWQHALACAYGAKLLAKELKLVDSERLFLIGLTHDIGKAVLLKAFAEISDKKKLDLDAVQMSMQQAHTSVGAYLLKRWGFNDEFVKVVMRHENNGFDGDAPEELLVINVVNHLTRNIGYSMHQGKTDLSKLKAAGLLYLTAEMLDSFEERLKEVLTEVSHLF